MSAKEIARKLIENCQLDCATFDQFNLMHEAIAFGQDNPQIDAYYIADGLYEAIKFYHRQFNN